MDLYLKQKVFSWNDKFSACDANGSPVYTVAGELFSLGKKLHIFDQSGIERCLVRQKLISFLPRYTLFRNGRDVAQVVRKITFFRPFYVIDGFGWKVEGDFFSHNYAIKDATGAIVATVAKRWLSWGDTYHIHTCDPADPTDVLAVVLAIDACMEAEQR